MARYSIDPDLTVVWIEARSNLHPIHSETTGTSGYLEAEIDAEGLLDLGTAPQASLQLPLARMSSGNPVYDREMRRRVDARRFPTITARLLAMTAEAEGRYRTEGDVTFRGVTQRVCDEMTLSAPAPGTVVLEGEHVFHLPDFGMEPPRIMMLKVYPDVTVRARIVARAE